MDGVDTTAATAAEQPPTRVKRTRTRDSRPAVSLAALADGEKSAVETVAEALVTAGFLDGLPADGETFRRGYARLRRYLGHGPSTSGPDADSLKWLSLRVQTFTTAD